MADYLAPPNDFHEQLLGDEDIATRVDNHTGHVISLPGNVTIYEDATELVNWRVPRDTEDLTDYLPAEAINYDTAEDWLHDNDPEHDAVGYHYRTDPRTYRICPGCDGKGGECARCRGSGLIVRRLGEREGDDGRC